MSFQAELTARQRQAVPIDRTHARRGRSAGGYDVAVPRTLAPGMDSELTRYPGSNQDQTLQRQRIAFYSVGQYRPAGDSWVNWTAAGPPRAELHMGTGTIRPEAGASRSRFPFVPGSPTGGMHTMIPSGPASSRVVPPRFGQSGNPQMRGARQDRLASARYTGQSYSQTTRVQGARG